MSLLDWISKNTYETKPDAAEPELRPRTYRKPMNEVLAAVQAAVAAIPRWKVVETDAQGGKVHATRTTGLWRFTDDIYVTVISGADGTLTLNVHSKSRVGKGDFGQNRRNILELMKQLDARVK